ncbi:UNVERIFIED_CONTAM: hypothetical protein K2H54_064442, partial [Gekko kuhli]
PLIAKPDVISWLEKGKELFHLVSDEEEGLAGSRLGAWESADETKRQQPMIEKEDTHSDVKEQSKHCDELRTEEGKHSLHGRINSVFLEVWLLDYSGLDPCGRMGSSRRSVLKEAVPGPQVMMNRPRPQWLLPFSSYRWSTGSFQIQMSQEREREKGRAPSHRSLIGGARDRIWTLLHAKLMTTERRLAPPLSS